MSIVGDSYKALVDKIIATLPTWYRLTNPLDTGSNFDSFMRLGWSLTADNGNNTNRHLCSKTTWNRTYSLTLSVELYGQNSDDDLYDDSVKALLEAITSVVLAIESDQTLGIANGAIVRVTNDSGIIPVPDETDSRKFIMCEIKIDIENFIGF